MRPRTNCGKRKNLGQPVHHSGSWSCRNNVHNEQVPTPHFQDSNGLVCTVACVRSHAKRDTLYCLKQHHRAPRQAVRPVGAKYSAKGNWTTARAAGTGNAGWCGPHPCLAAVTAAFTGLGCSCGVQASCPVSGGLRIINVYSYPALCVC